MTRTPTSRGRRRTALLAGSLAAAVLVPLAPAAWGQESPAPAPATAAPAAAAPSPQTRVRVSAPVVPAGTPVTLSVRVFLPDGTAVGSTLVDVVSRPVGGGSGFVAARATTGSDGLASVVLSPRTSAQYVVRSASFTSEPVVVEVQPLLTAAFPQVTVAYGATGVLRGRLTPAYAGARLKVERRFPDGSWRGVAVVGTDGSGAWSWPVRPTIAGRYVFRATLAASSAHRGVSTPAVALVVSPPPPPLSKDLRQGARGADVTALERRLLALKGDVGRVDGVFDNDLRHAVVAFQKSQGLARTGVADARTRARLATATPVRPRYGRAGRSVEVDLTKQVLYVSENGRVTRVVDVSTGNDELYTVDGVTERAFTPRGSFRITRKIDGIRVSRLGRLYRPAYFHRGWAVHGSPSVPAYPASHGCVRVTNAAMDRLYPLLTVGTPVTVYAS